MINIYENPDISKLNLQTCRLHTYILFIQNKILTAETNELKYSCIIFIYFKIFL
jgi:hypothetical protein